MAAKNLIAPFYVLPAAKFAVDHVRLNEAVGEGTEPKLEPLTSGLRLPAPPQLGPKSQRQCRPRPA